MGVSMDGMSVSQLSRWRRVSSWTFLCLFLGVFCATPVPAADWRKNKWFISWDNRFTIGTSYRLDDPDPRIIGLANGGTAFSPPD